VISFLIALFLFAFLAKVVVIGQNDLFDSAAFSFFHSYATPFTVKLMKGISFLGSSNFLLPAYIVLVSWLWLKKQKRLAFDISIIALSSELLKLGLKNGFQRERPELPLLESLKTYSFPSGHALSSFIFCSILIYVLWNENVKPVIKWILSVCLILLSVAIGISRIFLRYHYASDVFAGFCMGFTWVIFTLWLMNKIHFYIRKRKAKI
jgi:undecaprenyl-diphosphatase